MIQGIAHVALGASDFDQSCAFYVDGLKLPIFACWGEKPHRCILIDTGAGYLEIFEDGETLSKGHWMHVALQTEDVAGMYEQAIACGAISKTKPKTVHIQSKPEEHDFTIAFVYGPDGEEIEFFHMD
ncbi:MAG: VOC family protein [Clostridiales bacterium]|nr:VOC family protein [Clostridiales bacterium]